MVTVNNVLARQHTDEALINTVQVEIDSPRYGLRFHKPLEAQFQREMHETRTFFFLVCSLTGIALFNAFLLNDWMTLRDQFPLLVLMRTGLLTPLMLACLAFNYRTQSPFIREGGTVLMAWFCVAAPMGVMVLSDSPYRLHYQLGTLLVMLYCCVVQRMRFRYSLVATLGTLLIQFVATYFSGIMDLPTWMANNVFFISAGVFMLLATYFLERDERMSFLYALRGKLLQQRLEEVARTDPLTLLFNRRHLSETTALIWSQAAENPRTVSVVLIDIDHFKAFNDNYGHLQGDECLRKVSSSISQEMEGEGGQAFRFGGEEIMLLFQGRTPLQAAQLAERARLSVIKACIPHPVICKDCLLTVSVGVATATAPQLSADLLFGCADTALYEAKSRGKNCVSVASSTLL
jgi:diguanylate cyclase (GGDEF)-like protein